MSVEKYDHQKKGYRIRLVRYIGRVSSYIEYRCLYGPLIAEEPSSHLSMIVIIPCYKEAEVIPLYSLCQCDQPADGRVEIIVLINESNDERGDVSVINQRLHKNLPEQIEQTSVPAWMTFHVLYVKDLPPKHAGVGLARKIAMDEGVRRFTSINRNGILVNLDADCKVDPNYLVAVHAFFKSNPDKWSAGINYAHDLDSLAADHPIVAYELHLRYFVRAQVWAGLPFAYQTVGSCMCVRSDGYQKMGGMNRKKAGEDFYFSQKFIEVGRHGQIFSTTVRPSARSSDRVPFGTGRAISILNGGSMQMTSSLSSFDPVRHMLMRIDDLYIEQTATWLHRVGAPLQSFLKEQEIEKKIATIKEHTSSKEAFRKRFCQWFNAFLTIKYVHFARDTFPDVPVQEAASALYKRLTAKTFDATLPDLLKWYRKTEEQN